MTRTSIELSVSAQEAWTKLQHPETWEGVAGIENLTDAQHDSAGNLTGFRFATETALGRVDGRANVEPRPPGMTIRGAEKGLEITIEVVVAEQGEVSSATIDASARSTSFLTKPLAKTLNALLDKGLDAEAAKVTERICLR